MRDKLKLYLDKLETNKKQINGYKVVVKEYQGEENKMIDSEEEDENSQEFPDSSHTFTSDEDS